MRYRYKSDTGSMCHFKLILFNRCESPKILSGSLIKKGTWFCSLSVACVWRYLDNVKYDRFPPHCAKAKQDRVKQKQTRVTNGVRNDTR